MNTNQSYLLTAVVLAIWFNSHGASAAPSGLLDTLKLTNTRVNDEIHQAPEQPTATDALEESVESLLETNSLNNKDDEDDQRASNAVRSKRNAVTSSTEAYEESYVPVCSPCHGDTPVVHFNWASTLPTWTQRSDESMYADISDAADIVLNYTRNLIKRYEIRRLGVTAGNPHGGHPGLGISSQIIKQQARQEFLFPWPRQAQLPNLHNKECFDTYSETLYQALAVAQRHLLWVKNNDVGVGHRDTIHSATDDLVISKIPWLLCHLKKLSWQKNYQCEDDMEDYPITATFKQKSTKGRVQKYYRDYVLLKYVERTVKIVEWVFRYSAERNATETTTRGHLVTSSPFTTAPPRRRKRQHVHRRKHRRGQNGRRHRHSN